LRREKVFMNDRNVQPSVWYYGLAVLIIILGFVAFAEYLFTGVSSTESGLMQLAAPGNAELNLKEPGEYTIFYESQSYFNGSVYDTGGQIPGLKIGVSEKASGETLATYTATGTTYSMGGRSGQSITAFKVEKPGLYWINTSYPKVPGPKVILAVGKGFVEGIFHLITMAMLLLFGSIAIAAVITFVTYTRRKKAFLSQKEEEKMIRGGQ
jgi:hypothetical protein